MPAFPQSIGCAGLAQAAQPDAGDAHAVAVDLEPRRRAPDGVHGGERVLGGAEPGDLGLPVRHGAEEHRAVRDRLVARHRDPADERGGETGVDPHSCDSRGETMTE